MSMRTFPRWRVWLAATALLCSALLMTGCGRGRSGDGGSSVLTVYVPCGMELPFVYAAEMFEQRHPGWRVDVVLDNAGVLVQRILDRGERPDLIVSPGTLEMRRLQDEGAVADDAVVAFGQYELMLFVPRANPAGVTAIADLAEPSVEVIAIPDPDRNSVGAYIREALTSLRLWDELQPKLLLTDHPITAYKHVARERAAASFAYRSCPLQTAPDKLEHSRIRVIEPVPPETYGPALASIAPLVASPRQEAAAQFVELMVSPEGQELLREYGVPALRPSR